MFHYQGFHLSITTPFECPELLDRDESSESFQKIMVRFGDAPDHLDDTLNSGPVFEATNDHFLLKIKEIGNYLIRNGEEIIISPAPNVSESDLRLFLLGSAFGALLNQRGYLVLHASAIATPRGAVLFTGNSGAGKSTTVQGFIDRGYQKMADDTVALYYDEASQKVMVLPAFPNTKLWQKSADILGKDTEGLSRIRPTLDKFNLSTKEHFYNAPLELTALYQLIPDRTTAEIELKETASMEKFKILTYNTYRKNYAEKLLHKQNHFTLSTLAAKQCHIKRLKRPDYKNTLREVLDIIETDFSR